MEATHITIALESRAVLARDVAAQRAAARTILTVARPYRLLAARLADTHGHLVVAEGRKAAGELSRRLEIGLHHRLDLHGRWEPARCKPIADQRHLENAFAYLFRQDRHHGFTHDPAYEASNLPDLLGWRVLGDWTREHVRQWLPRYRLENLAEVAGLANGVAGGPLDLLADAAAAVIGVDALVGPAPAIVRARTAACHAADGTSRELADALDVPLRTIERARAKEPEDVLVRAIRHQLFLRSGLRTRQAEHDAAAGEESAWTGPFPDDERSWP